MNIALSFIFNCPLIAYFLKKNYSIRQNIFEKDKGLREVTHISPNWCLFGSYWSWDLIGNRQHEGLWRFAGKGVIGRCTGLWCPASGQFTGGELVAKEWPDTKTVFSQRPVRRWSSVWSIEDEGISLHRTLAASGRCPPDASGHDSRGFGPLWNRSDTGWQRLVATTEASSQ